MAQDAPGSGPPSSQSPTSSIHPPRLTEQLVAQARDVFKHPQEDPVLVCGGVRASEFDEFTSKNDGRGLIFHPDDGAGEAACGSDTTGSVYLWLDPSDAHEGAGIAVFTQVYRQLGERVVGRASPQRKLPNGRRKEPDMAIFARPHSTAASMPTVVVEVAVSERTAHLLQSLSDWAEGVPYALGIDVHAPDPQLGHDGPTLASSTRLTAHLAQPGQQLRAVEFSPSSGCMCAGDPRFTLELEVAKVLHGGPACTSPMLAWWLSLSAAGAGLWHGAHAVLLQRRCALSAVALAGACLWRPATVRVDLFLVQQAVLEALRERGHE